MKYIAGVEEAGRGPVIGPMVMVVAAVEPDKEASLKDLDVKDSKLLIPSQRTRIAKKLRTMLNYEMKVLEAKDVDAALEDPDMNLNWLEAVTSAQLIDKLSKKITISKAILDCPSTNINAYKSYVEDKLKKKVPIVAEHKADVNYPVVSAASIIAKVERDELIAQIKKKIGVDFGSGYPSDPRTIEFVKKHYKDYDIFRKTWSTYKKATGEKKQKRLGDY